MMTITRKLYNRDLNRQPFRNTLQGMLLLSLLAASYPAMAAIQVELLGAYPNITSVRVTGNVSDVPAMSGSGFATANTIAFYTNDRFGGYSGGAVYEIRVNTHFPENHYSYIVNWNAATCPRSLSAWRSSVNSNLNGRVIPRSVAGSGTGGYYYRFEMSCYEVSAQGILYYPTIYVQTPGYDIDVPNPPNPPSVCSLNNQNLTYSYSSSNLNVDGLSQSRSATISCTAGTAQNYRLRLTGSNVVSGRLNFGNGVSAQISLNGTQVSANGTGISLNGLTGRSLSVNSTLVGTASGSGTTNANGVLVLEAL